MNERLNSIITKIKETLKNLSPKAKKLIIAGIALSIIFSVGIAAWLNNRPYDTLFTGLNEQESSELIGKLREDGIDYKYESRSDGGAILVREKNSEQIKAELVYEGYPKSGFTYDIFNNIDLTTSESEKQSYMLFQLQERMGATISAFFDDVKEAVVTIALGEERRYVLDENSDTKATASVTLTTKSGNDLSTQEVEAIQRLVSKSIPQLEFANVDVICNGKTVTVDGNNTQSGANQLKMEVEAAIDNKIKGKILDLLIPIYGAEHIQVSVKSEVDINKKIRELINYSPEDQNNTGVKSSESAHQEVSKDGETVGGVPGTETNSDIPIYTRITQDGNEDYIISEGAVDYLVDQVKEQQQVDAGDIVDLTVAIIIDTEDMSEGTRNNLISLVAKAAGINTPNLEDKIELLNMPFYREAEEPEPSDDDNIPDMERIKRLLIIGGIIVGALLIVLLIIFIIVRKILKKRKKKRGAAEDAFGGEPVVYDNNGPKSEPAPNIADAFINLQNERSMELKNKIREITDENPEITAQTIKTWLRGESNGGK